MEPRTCPECGTKNDPDEPNCTNCKLVLPKPMQMGLLSGPASILNLQQQPAAPESGAPPPPPQQPVSPGGTFGAVPAGQPVSGAYAAPGRAAPPPTTMQAPARFERPARLDSGVNWRFVVVLALALSAATAAMWWFFFRPPAPADTVTRLVSACESGNLDEMKSCFTRASLPRLGLPTSGSQLVNGFARTGSFSPSIRVVDTRYEGVEEETAVVQCEPTDLPEGAALRCYLVMLQEDGDWKIDVGRTVERVRKQSATPAQVSGG